MPSAATTMPSVRPMAAHRSTSTPAPISRAASASATSTTTVGDVATDPLDARAVARQQDQPAASAAKPPATMSKTPATVTATGRRGGDAIGSSITRSQASYEPEGGGGMP